MLTTLSICWPICRQTRLSWIPPVRKPLQPRINSRITFFQQMGDAVRKRRDKCRSHGDYLYPGQATIKTQPIPGIPSSFTVPKSANRGDSSVSCLNLCYLSCLLLCCAIMQLTIDPSAGSELPPASFATLVSAAVRCCALAL